MRQRKLTWDEQEGFTGWRRFLHWQPGERKRLKQRAHQYDRRVFDKQTIKEQLDEPDPQPRRHRGAR